MTRAVTRDALPLVEAARAVVQLHARRQAAWALTSACLTDAPRFRRAVAALVHATSALELAVADLREALGLPAEVQPDELLAHAPHAATAATAGPEG